MGLQPVSTTSNSRDDVPTRAVDEYRKTIEKDAALQRRFQPIMVNEPSVEVRGIPDLELH